MGNTQFETNDGLLIQTIKDSVPIEVFKDLKPEHFTSHKIFEVPKKPLIDTLQLATLSGLVDYLADALDADARANTFVQVESPTRVSVRCGVTDREDRRFTPVVVVADVPNVKLLAEDFMEHQDAIIELQSLFVETEAQKNLIRILGTIVKDDMITQEDDGATQTVSTRSGIKVSEDTIVNPVSLKPFRTFAEIDQPESPFIVRLEKDNGIEIALFEADGGAWRNVARQSIKAYLGVLIEVTIIA